MSESDIFSGKTQSLAYIGKKPVKRDTVAGTGVIWAGYGDVQVVPHQAAVKMLRHTDVWITEVDFNRRVENGSVTDQSDQSGGQDDGEGTGENGDDSGSDGTGDGGTGESDTGDNGQTGGGLSDAGEGDQGKQPTGDDAVKNAILSLETGNPDHFSEKTGNPIIGAVRKAAGDDSINVQQVNAAWKALSKSD